MLGGEGKPVGAGGLRTNAGERDVGNAGERHGVHLARVDLAADGALERVVLPRGLDDALDTLRKRQTGEMW